MACGRVFSRKRDFLFWGVVANARSLLAMDSTTLQRDHLKALIIAHYSPARDLRDADFSATTLELFAKFHQAFPGINFNLEDVYTLMVSLGYEMIDRSEMEFAWVVKNM